MAEGHTVAAESAQRWRDVRAVLTANRHELGRVAATLYRTCRGPGRRICYAVRSGSPRRRSASTTCR